MTRAGTRRWTFSRTKIASSSTETLVANGLEPDYSGHECGHSSGQRPNGTSVLSSKWASSFAKDDGSAPEGNSFSPSSRSGPSRRGSVTPSPLPQPRKTAGVEQRLRTTGKREFGNPGKGSPLGELMTVSERPFLSASLRLCASQFPSSNCMDTAQILPSRGLPLFGFRIPGWLRVIPRALESTHR